MKRSRLLLLLVALSLAIAPLTVFAQGDDDMEYEEYISEDGRLSVMYPAGWLAYEDDEVPVPNITFGNTENALEFATSDEDDLEFAEGDIALAVLILPTDFMALLGVEVPEEADLDFATAIVESFVLSDDPEEDEDIQIGEPEEVELDDETSAGYIEVIDEDQEGAFVVFMLSDDLIVLAFAATSVGAFEDEYGDTLVDVVSTVSFEGTGADIMLELMGGGAESGDDMDDMSDDDMSDDDMGDDDTSDDSQGAIDGATLVTERCTVCHSADRITSSDKDEAGWTATVDRMIGYGAVLDGAERDALIAYLIAVH